MRDMCAAPAEVGQVNASSSPPDAVHLAWAPPSDNGASIISYRIRGKEASENTFLTLSSDIVQVDEDGRGAVIAGLQPGGIYTFKVAAINSMGVGKESASSEPFLLAVKTLAPTGAGDVPGGPVDLAEGLFPLPSSKYPSDQ